MNFCCLEQPVKRVTEERKGIGNMRVCEARGKKDKEKSTNPGCTCKLLILLFIVGKLENSPSLLESYLKTRTEAAQKLLQGRII